MYILSGQPEEPQRPQKQSSAPLNRYSLSCVKAIRARHYIGKLVGVVAIVRRTDSAEFCRCRKTLKNRDTLKANEAHASLRGKSIHAKSDICEERDLQRGPC